MAVVEQISYTKAEAAAATGVSIASIERAIKAGRLVAHYPTARPVIRVEELRAWIEGAPTDPPTDPAEVAS